MTFSPLSGPSANDPIADVHHPKHLGLMRTPTLLLLSLGFFLVSCGSQGPSAYNPSDIDGCYLSPGFQNIHIANREVRYGNAITFRIVEYGNLDRSPYIVAYVTPRLYMQRISGEERFESFGSHIEGSAKLLETTDVGAGRFFYLNRLNGRVRFDKTADIECEDILRN